MWSSCKLWTINGWEFSKINEYWFTDSGRPMNPDTDYIFKKWEICTEKHNKTVERGKRGGRKNSRERIWQAAKAKRDDLQKHKISLTTNCTMGTVSLEMLSWKRLISSQFRIPYPTKCLLWRKEKLSLDQGEMREFTFNRYVLVGNPEVFSWSRRNIIWD